MPRLSIQRFRYLVAGHAPAGNAVRAYRELARRPGLAGGARFHEWGTWASAAGEAPAR